MPPQDEAPISDGTPSGNEHDLRAELEIEKRKRIELETKVYGQEGYLKKVTAEKREAEQKRLEALTEIEKLAAEKAADLEAKEKELQLLRLQNEQLERAKTIAERKTVNASVLAEPEFDINDPVFKIAARSIHQAHDGDQETLRKLLRALKLDLASVSAEEIRSTRAGSTPMPTNATEEQKDRVETVDQLYERLMRMNPSDKNYKSVEKAYADALKKK